MNDEVAYGKTTIPDGIRSRQIDNGNGLSMHILEAGFDRPESPCILLLHGFPELAYSWRKVMLPLAEAGYHVVAPDQSGYGRTTGWDPDYDGDLASFRILNLVRDALGLVLALGYQTVASVIGHDFGSPVAAWSSLIHPDVFQSVVLMSSPFGGPPLPTDIAQTKSDVIPPSNIHDDLAALPSPRKHYQWYYSTPEANDDVQKGPQGVHNFLRAYYHFKSADWAQNKPHPLESWSAQSIAELPKYYVMNLDKGMTETVAPAMPSSSKIETCNRLPDEELQVYSEEYARNGFQGGLQWYRCATGSQFIGELRTYSGRTIDVPSCYIADKSDWGTFQKPGNFEKMQSEACTQMRDVHLMDEAGHWVQQEQPGVVARLLTAFLDGR